MSDRGPPPAETRDRIIEAAAALLAGSADATVSTRAVCERAGITAPTLYHHFGSKEGLLDEVVSYGFDQYLEVKRQTESTGDPIADLRQGWKRHVQFGLDNPALYTLMYGRPMRTNPPPAAGEARAALEGILTQADHDGRLGVDIALATDMVLAANVGTTLTLIASGPDRNTALADSLLELVVDAITRA